MKKTKDQKNFELEIDELILELAKAIARSEDAPDHFARIHLAKFGFKDVEIDPDFFANGVYYN